MIITIGREYGSGGHYIAEELAKRLNIPVYDRQIIEEVVKRSNFAPEFIKSNEEKVHSFFDSFFGGQLSVTDNLFIAETNAIKELAEKGDAIFVGRCADYVLKDKKDLIKIFIQASMESKIDRITKYYGIEESKAEDKIVKTNKARARYHNYFTDTKWGRSYDYDLLVSSDIGVSETVDVLELFIKHKKDQLDKKNVK